MNRPYTRTRTKERDSVTTTYRVLGCPRVIIESGKTRDIITIGSRVYILDPRPRPTYQNPLRQLLHDLVEARGDDAVVEVIEQFFQHYTYMDMVEMEHGFIYPHWP